MLKQYTVKVKKNGRIQYVSYVCENQKEFLEYLKLNGFKRFRTDINKIKSIEIKESKESVD